MNALFVLRPAKLWAFNFGHPCPPSKKGEVLLLGQAEPTMVGIEFDRTSIPLAFRRASVCVCLVGFASLQSPWAHTLKASLPCLPLPLHRTSQSPQSLQKNNNPFASHHHPCPMNALLVSHYPSKSTITLATPRKRGGGTAVEFFRLAVQYSDSLTFMILKQFQAVTVGIEIDRSTTLKNSKL